MVWETVTATAAAGTFAFMAWFLKRRGSAAKPAPVTGPSGGGEQGAERPAGEELAIDVDPARQAPFGGLADAVSDAVLVHTDRILYANPAAVALFGQPEDILRGMLLTDLVHPEHRARLAAFLEGHGRSGTAGVPTEIHVLDAESRPIPVTLEAFAPDGESVGPHGTILRRIPDERPSWALADEGAVARQALECIGEGIITTGVDRRIDYMNRAAELMTACRRENVLGRRLEDLVSLVDETDRKPLGDPVSRCLDENQRVDLGRRTLLIARATGAEHSIELTASPLNGGGAASRGVVLLLHDVSEMRGLARQMSYQASHDPLTGLYNRREFERRIDDSLKDARSGNGSHVLAYLDLDRFKAVNDSCGHTAGDNLLREVAGLIRAQVRDSDSVGRLGGDEFGMLLTGCPLDKARQIADDVCDAIRDYKYVWRDRIFSVGVSIGLVELGHESGALEDVIGAADSACYVAKQQGRGRVHVYSARDEAVARQRGEIAWLQRIQRALKEDAFQICTQPIVSLAGHVDRGPALEVFLRLQETDASAVSPSQFMQAAERYQLMPNVDRWVIQRTFALLGSGGLRVPPGRSVALNISGQTLGDERFLEFVVDCLDRTGVNPQQVCFEVTESSVITNLNHAARFIAVLHGMGCQFAVDDFGSGMGSFTNLRTLAMDYLKIDGSFSRDLGQDEVSRAMVAAMIKLARTLGIRVVAEQVETREAIDLLREMGVDFAQGYAVGRPEPISEQGA